MATRCSVRDLTLLILATGCSSGVDDPPAAAVEQVTLPRGGHVWTHRFPGVSLGGDIAADGNGTIIAGEFDGTVDFGGGPRTAIGGRDLFVAEVEPFGEISWGRTFQGSREEGMSALVRDAEGSLYISGAQLGDLDLGECGVLPDQPEMGGFDFPWFIAKLDARGGCVWARQFVPEPGAWSVRLSDLALDSSGNLIVVGEVTGSLDLGGVTLDAPADHLLGFVAKLDPDGDPRWGRVYGTANDVAPWAGVVFHDAASDGGDGVVVTGVVIGDASVDLGSGAIGGERELVASLDGDGDGRWSRDFPRWVMSAGGLATNAAGEIAFGGFFDQPFELDGHRLVPVESSTNAYVAKLTPGGAATWVKPIWGVSDPQISRLAVTPGGNVIVTGYTFEGGGLHLGGTRWEVPQRSRAMLVARLGVTTGSTVWARVATGQADNQVIPYATTVTDNGRVMVYGTWSGAIDLGGGMMTASGRGEGFLVRYYP